MAINIFSPIFIYILYTWNHSLEFCLAAILFQTEWPTRMSRRRDWPLVLFGPSALPYHHEWQAGRSAGVTLLTVSILFFLFPALKNMVKHCTFPLQKWVGSVGGGGAKTTQPCFRFQLICHLKAKLHVQKGIIANELSLTSHFSCQKKTSRA